MKTKLLHSLLCTVAVCGTASTAYAQVRPDAGQTMQQLQQEHVPTPPAATPALKVEAPKASAAKPGGPKMLVKSVVFKGNSLFTDEQLHAVLGKPEGKEYSMAQLKGLAELITAHYWEAGYNFSSAIIPKQKPKNGELTIQIIEARYGQTQVTGASDKEAAVREYMEPLKQGELITGDELFRTTQVLQSVPGYNISPALRMGGASGTGDLIVDVQDGKRFGGDVGANDYGNRFTGVYQGYANLYMNRLAVFGDQLTLSSQYSNENMWFGALNYGLPLGTSGLRGNVGYSHSYYELGKTYSALDAHGTADTASAGVSYPIIISKNTNLGVAATYQHKWLRDDIALTSTSTGKSSDSLPIALNFDNHDTLLGGGVMYGTFTWTHGALDLGNGLEATDNTTARTNGNYDKLNFDVTRLQNMIEGFVLSARGAGQWAGSNLDSSEKFGLGGSGGVRAYPSGESFGDEGALTQIELRRPIEAFTPYALFDAGWIKTNVSNWTTGSTTERTLSGVGLGLRFEMNGWHADGSAAWRVSGGPPQSDHKNDIPSVLASLGYRF